MTSLLGGQLDGANQEEVEDNQQHEREQDKEEYIQMVVHILVRGIVTQLGTFQLHRGAIGRRIVVLIDDPLEGRGNGGGNTNQAHAKDQLFRSGLGANHFALDGMADCNVSEGGSKFNSLQFFTLVALPFNRERNRQPNGSVRSGIGDHVEERYHVPIVVIVQVMSIGIVLQRENERKDQVDHVEDGQCGQIPIGR